MYHVRPRCGRSADAEAAHESDVPTKAMRPMWRRIRADGAAGAVLREVQRDWRVSDRGDYRILYLSLADDPDVHALSGDAFKLWAMLKLSLPVTGIGVVYPSMLCDQVGVDRARLETIMAELEHPKAGRECGWIRREKNVVWLINGLRFESGLTPANGNHQKYVQKLVAQLDERQKIVADFKTAYHQWFQPLPKPIRKGSRSHPDPSESANENESANASTNTSANEQSEEAAAHRVASLEGSPVAELPRDAIVFAETFYPTNERRRAQVIRQLRQTLNGGAKLDRGTRVFARSVDRLAEKCREVLDDGVRNYDRAIVVLLKKLNDTSDVTERIARVEKTERAEEERHTARDVTNAEAWLAEHPDVDAAIEARLEAEQLGARVDRDPIAGPTRRMMRRSQVLTAWRNAGAPEAVHV